MGKRGPKPGTPSPRKGIPTGRKMPEACKNPKYTRPASGMKASNIPAGGGGGPLYPKIKPGERLLPKPTFEALSMGHMTGAEMRKRAEELAEKAMETLKTEMEAAPGTANRLNAAREVLDRAFGKPSQAITGKDEGPVEVVYHWGNSSGNS